MTRVLSIRIFALGIAMILAGAWAATASELIVLRGGKTLELSKPYVIRGSQAVLTLKDGTVLSVAAGEIDRAATQAARARSVAKKSDEAAEVVVSPADAARAQKNAPKARLKVGDDEVSHPYIAADEGTKDAGDGDARVEVVDWEQKAENGSVSVKGNLRNAGSASADGISMLVMGKDDKGKTLASTNANVAAGTLEAGSVTTFTATLSMPARAASLRFVPKWSSAVTAAKAEKSGEAASVMQKHSAEAAATAASPATAAPPAASPATAAYTPVQGYAPPAANSPTSPPDDNHIPYVPSVHEENPPPPPN